MPIRWVIWTIDISHSFFLRYGKDNIFRNWGVMAFYLFEYCRISLEIAAIFGCLVKLPQRRTKPSEQIMPKLYIIKSHIIIVDLAMLERASGYYSFIIGDSISFSCTVSKSVCWSEIDLRWVKKQLKTEFECMRCSLGMELYPENIRLHRVRKHFGFLFTKRLLQLKPMAANGRHGREVY